MQCLIYKITNIIDNKVYVGQTWKTLDIRFYQHCSKSGSIKLYRSIQKYGKNNFKIELVTIAHTQSIADYWEIYFIELFKSCDRNKGYNIRGGGSHGKLSKETRKKLSIASMGRVKTEEEKRKISDAQRGNKYNIGRKVLDETKNKISDKLKGRASPNKDNMKLLPYQIINILQDNRPSRIIAKEYGVSHTLILRTKKL